MRGIMQTQLSQSHKRRFPKDIMSIEYGSVPLVYLVQDEGILKHYWATGIPTPSIMRTRLHQMYQKYFQQLDPLFQKLNIPTCITEVCVCYVTGEKYN
jgi:hypothetical protein